MLRVCGAVFFLANLMAFIGAIPILAMGWLMMTNSHSHCDHHLYPQLLEIGSFLLITSLFGMIGLCYRIRSLLWIYLVLVVTRFLLLVVMMTLSMASIHNQKAFKSDYSSGEEYKVEDFSSFARDYIDKLKWEASRSCIIKYRSCRGFDYYRSSMSRKNFMQQHPVVWGCCQPPESCGYRYEGEMMWTVPEKGIQSNNTDCYKYMNNKEVLCTECDTCKAGFLALIYGDWLKLVMINSFIADLILGLLLFAVIADLIAIRDIYQTKDIQAPPKL